MLSRSAYTYTKATGVITIASVTGDVEIIARGAAVTPVGATPPSAPLLPVSEPIVTARPVVSGHLLRTVTDFYGDEDEKTAASGISHTGNDVMYLADIELQISSDGGMTWRKATADDIEGGKATVYMPLPEGTSAETHSFIIYHFASGSGINGAATPMKTTVENNIAAASTENGDFSPYLIVGTPKDSPTTGDASRPGTWALCMLLSLSGLAITSVARRSKKSRR